MRQENVRQRLINYLSSSGVKQNFVAEKIDVPISVISRFKNNKKALLKSSLDELDEYLTKQGY